MDVTSASPLCRASDTHSMRDVTHAGIVFSAIGYAHITRVVFPRAAPDDMLAAVGEIARRAVSWRALVVLEPAIGYQLRDAATHVVQPKCVRRVAAHLCRLLRIVYTSAAL